MSYQARWIADTASHNHVLVYFIVVLVTGSSYCIVEEDFAQTKVYYIGVHPL